MTDSQTRIIDLALRLERKAARGMNLSPEERVIVDVAWIDTMVSPDGFTGWLSATSSARITSTLAALDDVGASDVKGLVLEALAAVGIDPATTSDDQREQMVDDMTDAAREDLSRLDAGFYDASDLYMDRCWAFVESHRGAIEGHGR